jgi:hypothetical protein
MPGVFCVHSTRVPVPHAPTTEEMPMAKPNYKFDKRQRDLAKKKQQDAKLLKKRAKKGGDGTTPAASDPPAESTG